VISPLDIHAIDALTEGRIGCHDIPCPLCGPLRRAPVNQRRRVLRVWRIGPELATFHCARCGEKGRVGRVSADRLSFGEFKRSIIEARERERVAVGQRIEKARWLWTRCRPIRGTIAEHYLRSVRGYFGALPSTLGFLPARGKHGPAMIAAFGLPSEPTPGELSIKADCIRGIHITRLAPDGTGKAGTGSDKIMLGASLASPIVLAPANDSLGLAITEGIEDALSVHEATMLGAWAAGSASRMPALADAVPSYLEIVTIMVDDDPDGRRHAARLHDQLASKRKIEVRSLLLASIISRAAA
jgi:hypothetical protein